MGDPRSGVDGCLGDQGGICISSPGVLSSPLSKGEIIGSTGITLFNLFGRSVGSSDCLLFSLSLFSCSIFSSSFFSKSLQNYLLQDEIPIFK